MTAGRSGPVFRCEPDVFKVNTTISVCDDYSLPIDFVKKRPSSFDPCLVQHIPNNWASPSPQSDHVSIAPLHTCVSGGSGLYKLLKEH
uniref:Uncharacterized protein n=1 Tax=Anopheles albimanus TaxID=7167 RepID=A0A182FM60_ANOAL